MKKSFGISCFIALVLLLTGLVTGNYQLYGNILLGIGAVSVVISALLSGVFLSGPEMRGNYYSGTKEHRESRTKGMMTTGIFSLPLLVSAAFLLLI